MKKFFLGLFITVLVISFGINCGLVIELRKLTNYDGFEPEYGRYEITCNPTAGMVLNYVHYGYYPTPVANNLHLYNEDGELFTLYNMMNCIIIETDLNKDPTPSKLPMTNPRPKPELTV